MGHKRAHAELSGQGEGLPVVWFGLRGIRGLAERRDVAEKPQGVCFMASFPVFPGEFQCALGEGVCLLQAARRDMHLPQGETTERSKTCCLRGRGLFHRLREQSYGLGDTSG